MNKYNFWNSSIGVWTILQQHSEVHQLITSTINMLNALNIPYIANYNESGSVFYARADDFVIRIAKNWETVETCNWELDRDYYPSLWTAAIIKYENLESLPCEK